MFVRSNQNVEHIQRYIYRITCHEQEQALCSMEMRALWGVSFSGAASTQLFITNRYQSVDRSPFVKYSLEIVCSARSLDELEQEVMLLSTIEQSFKVVALDEQEDLTVASIAYAQRRSIERTIGSKLKGKVELSNPQLLFGVVRVDEDWFFGKLAYHQPLWQAHNEKPRQYSTALSTKVARSVVNIAVPSLTDPISLYDPCCGIGTVLMEACSQGIASAGSDINPLAVLGARENMQAFRYDCPIKIQDMTLVEESYDVAILDLPYNHCSVLSIEERTSMLESIGRIAKRFVVVSVEPIAEQLLELGYTIDDRCIVQKMQFQRELFLCHK